MSSGSFTFERVVIDERRFFFDTFGAPNLMAVVQIPVGGSVDREHEPKQRRELLDASPEHDDLLPEFRVRAGGHVTTDDGRRPAEQPRAVERGTPRSVARVTSPVR
jgi:hypothetical protein